MLISARAIRSRTGFVYIRGEYVEPWRRFSAAVKEAYDAGLLGKGFDIVVHRGAARTSAARRRACSRRSRARRLAEDQAAVPGREGGFDQPTIVNNVETICHVPHIINRGAAWFAGLGTATQAARASTPLRAREAAGDLRGARLDHAAPAHLRSRRRRHGQRPPQGRRARGSSAAILTATRSTA